ncbi:hypothetical protein BH23CHL7_BH23CHL7_22990 [soil metagenome]
MLYIVALILAAVSAWAITVIGSGTLERAVSAFALLIGGWRPDPWPHGVQEEDRDRPWGWRLLSRARGRTASVVLEEGAAAVPASRVRSRTKAR